jgi:hypothetical protein
MNFIAKTNKLFVGDTDRFVEITDPAAEPITLALIKPGVRSS